MPLVSFGFCFSPEIKKQKTIDKLIHILIEHIFNYEKVSHYITYLYDNEQEKPTMLEKIDSIWDDALYNHDNKSIYKVGMDDISISIKNLGNDLAIEMNVDYDMLIESKSNNKEMISHIESCFLEIYDNIGFRFAFLDFDSECDITYEHLLHTVKEFKIPYTLLLIEDNGIKIYRSGFDLLGIPIM